MNFCLDLLKAFVIGGILCALVQLLMEKTKMMPGRIMVLLVCLGVVTGALGIYDSFIDFAGAGATVPLTGFGYTLWSGVKEAITNEGFIGIFKGGLGASAIGISSSLILGYVASLIFNPKVEV